MSCPHYRSSEEPRQCGPMDVHPSKTPPKRSSRDLGVVRRSPFPVRVHPSKNSTPAQPSDHLWPFVPPRRCHAPHRWETRLDLEAFSPCGRPDPRVTFPRPTRSLLLPWASDPPPRLVHTRHLRRDGMPHNRFRLCAAVARPQPSLRGRETSTPERVGCVFSLRWIPPLVHRPASRSWRRREERLSDRCRRGVAFHRSEPTDRHGGLHGVFDVKEQVRRTFVRRAAALPHRSSPVSRVSRGDNARPVPTAPDGRSVVFGRQPGTSPSHLRFRRDGAGRDRG